LWVCCCNELSERVVPTFSRSNATVEPGCVSKSLPVCAANPRSPRAFAFLTRPPPPCAASIVYGVILHCGGAGDVHANRALLLLDLLVGNPSDCYAAAAANAPLPAACNDAGAVVSVGVVVSTDGGANEVARGAVTVNGVAPEVRVTVVRGVGWDGGTKAPVTSGCERVTRRGTAPTPRSLPQSQTRKNHRSCAALF
jgi:hypothetical protein